MQFFDHNIQSLLIFFISGVENLRFPKDSFQSFPNPGLHSRHELHQTLDIIVIPVCLNVELNLLTVFNPSFNIALLEPSDGIVVKLIHPYKSISSN